MRRRPSQTVQIRTSWIFSPQHQSAPRDFDDHTVIRIQEQNHDRGRSAEWNGMDRPVAEEKLYTPRMGRAEGAAALSKVLIGVVHGQGDVRKKYAVSAAPAGAGSVSRQGRFIVPPSAGVVERSIHCFFAGQNRVGGAVADVLDAKRPGGSAYRGDRAVDRVVGLAPKVGVAFGIPDVGLRTIGAVINRIRIGGNLRLLPAARRTNEVLHNYGIILQAIRVFLFNKGQNTPKCGPRLLLRAPVRHAQAAISGRSIL